MGSTVPAFGLGYSDIEVNDFVSDPVDVMSFDKVPGINERV
jgi:hypothetical protein